MNAIDTLINYYETINKQNPYEISKEHIQHLRKDLHQYENTESLGYGEIDVNSFHNLLEEILENDEIELEPERDYFLVDIGSGSAKSVFVASLINNKLPSIGIEIIKNLHDLAIKSKTELEYDDNVELHNGDSFDEKYIKYWSNCQILFLPITLFTEELMNEVYHNLIHYVKENTILITTTRLLDEKKLITNSTNGKKKKKISNKQFILMQSTRKKYSKGSLMFHVYKLL